MLNNHYTHICLGLDWPDGIRLDKCLAELYPRFSRSEWQEAIAVGGVFIDGAVCEKSAHRTSGGRELMMDFSALPQPASDCSAEDIALNIVYEDADIIVLNKPSGLVVHPGRGNMWGTLQAALLYHHPPAVKMVRAGIVHRLDKDTSGLLAVAKNPLTQKRLVEKFKKREIGREYLALVYGEPPPTGVINRPIGRSRREPTLMAVRASGRPAITRFAVEKRWPGFALLRCWLDSGRTHQIRVHLEYAGYPVVGDKHYVRRARRASFGLTRQALHATALRLHHPTDDTQREWQCPPPPDIRLAIEMLDNNAG